MSSERPVDPQRREAVPEDQELPIPDHDGAAQRADRVDRDERVDERPHDEGGLELARAVARSLANAARGAARHPHRRTPGRGGPERRRRTAPQASGAHPDDRDPQLLDTTLGRLVAEQGWDTDVRVHGVFSRWDHIVGAEVARHCSPTAFAEGRLTVRTDSTAWATQLRLLATTVLRRLNEELGPDTVRFLDVQGPSGPGWKRGRYGVRDGRGPRDTYG